MSCKPATMCHQQCPVLCTRHAPFTSYPPEATHSPAPHINLSQCAELAAPNFLLCCCFSTLVFIIFQGRFEILLASFMWLLHVRLHLYIQLQKPSVLQCPSSPALAGFGVCDPWAVTQPDKQQVSSSCQLHSNFCSKTSLQQIPFRPIKL